MLSRSLKNTSKTTKSVVENIIQEKLEKNQIFVLEYTIPPSARQVDVGLIIARANINNNKICTGAKYST